jgi:uncharacterized coiled-coil protein SlyX
MEIDARIATLEMQLEGALLAHRMIIGLLTAQVPVALTKLQALDADYLAEEIEAKSPLPAAAIEAFRREIEGIQARAARR